VIAPAQQQAAVALALPSPRPMEVTPSMVGKQKRGRRRIYTCQKPEDLRLSMDSVGTPLGTLMLD
jgi:hypothetical protein